MTQKFEEASQSIFNRAEIFSKGDLKSKMGKQTIHFQSTTQTKKSLFILFWCAISSVFGLIITIEIKKLIVVKVRNFQQKTSRTWTHRKSECERKKRATPFAQVSQSFSAEVGKRPTFCDQTFDN